MPFMESFENEGIHEDLPRLYQHGNGTGGTEGRPGEVDPASRLASKGDDGRFDLYVAVNGRNDWHDLE
jgi:hypothetical protein